MENPSFTVLNYYNWIANSSKKKKKLKMPLTRTEATGGQSSGVLANSKSLPIGNSKLKKKPQYVAA